MHIGERSPIAAAKDVTLAVVERRARLYRNCAVAVSIMLLGTVFGVLLVPWIAALIGLTLLAAVVGTYLLLDLRVVRIWQSYVLDAWWSGMNLADLSAALLTHPVLPRNTLEGMFDTLPSEPAATPGQTTTDGKAALIRKVDLAGLSQARCTAAGAMALMGVLCGTYAIASRWAALGLFAAGAATVLTAFRTAHKVFSNAGTGRVLCHRQT